MRIGFDISQTGQMRTGCGFFAENLINALIREDKKNQYVLYPSFGEKYWDGTKKYSNNQKNVITADLPNNFESSRTFWGSLPKDTNLLGDVEIIHSNNFYCLKKLNNIKFVYTLYDLTFLECPEYTTEQNRINCFEGVFKASIYADHIVAISEYSKNQFLLMFPHYDSNNISVAYPASRFEKISANNKNIRRFITRFKKNCFWLSVGTLEPRKNIRRLLFAYKKLIDFDIDCFPLLLVGKNGWLEDDLPELIHTLGLKKKVHILGYINDDELSWIYSNCFCFIYPSLLEGFGLPVVEAMQHGAPVITSNLGSIPEVAGDAAISVNPYEVDTIQNAMQRMLGNPTLRNELSLKAIKQAKKFSWQNTAKQVMGIYEMLSGAGS